LDPKCISHTLSLSLEHRHTRTHTHTHTQSKIKGWNFSLLTTRPIAAPVYKKPITAFVYENKKQITAFGYENKNLGIVTNCSET